MAASVVSRYTNRRDETRVQLNLTLDDAKALAVGEADPELLRAVKTVCNRKTDGEALYIEDVEDGEEAEAEAV